ncbi:MAG: hypothetical protein ACRDOI_46330 [Trebonia sp.]
MAVDVAEDLVVHELHPGPLGTKALLDQTEHIVAAEEVVPDQRDLLAGQAGQIGVAGPRGDRTTAYRVDDIERGLVHV